MWKTPVAQAITARKRYTEDASNEAAPEGAGNTYEGLTTTDRVGVEMATPHATGSLAARLDGCPACVDNTEVPYGAFHTPAGSLVGMYRCSDCGHRWHTAWAGE